MFFYSSSVYSIGTIIGIVIGVLISVSIIVAIIVCVACNACKRGSHGAVIVPRNVHTGGVTVGLYFFVFLFIKEDPLALYRPHYINE